MHPAVQIWPYGEAPPAYQFYVDDADWVVFVPNEVGSQIDVEMHLSGLGCSGFYGPVNFPEGQVWVACHA